MIGKSLGTLAAKVLVVAVTVGAVTGCLVAAGALSGSVQTGASVGASGVTGTVQADADEHASAQVAATATGEDADASPSASPKPKESASSATADEKSKDNAQGNDNGQGDENGQGHDNNKGAANNHATGDDVVNHGRCVSFAAQAADKLGLEGKAKGDFISAVARNEDAVSDTVPDGAKPDAACAAAILRAAKDAKTSSVTSASVTGTVGITNNGSSNVINQGHGRGGH